MAFNDLAVIFAREALAAKAEQIEKRDIPEADKLSKSESQTPATRDYFTAHTSELKDAVAAIRRMARDLA